VAKGTDVSATETSDGRCSQPEYLQSEEGWDDELRGDGDAPDELVAGGGLLGATGEPCERAAAKGSSMARWTDSHVTSEPSDSDWESDCSERKKTKPKAQALAKPKGKTTLKTEAVEAEDNFDFFGVGDRPSDLIKHSDGRCVSDGGRRWHGVCVCTPGRGLGCVGMHAAREEANETRSA
jgi:hypothetical protein